jgi:hypothetical protein
MPNIGPFELLIVLVFGLLLGYVVANHARNKGYSFGLFFLLWLLFWPVAAILVLALPDRHAPRGAPPA